MNDEIRRLMGLRRAALDARALAQALSETNRRDSAAGRSGVLCWRIARLATVQLRAHPHRAYQRDPGLLEAAMGTVRGLVLGSVAAYRKRSMEALRGELQGLSRRLDDVRALTLSAELSDTVGRSQLTMRQLLEEVCGKARIERGLRPELHAAPTQGLTVGTDQIISTYLGL